MFTYYQTDLWKKYKPDEVMNLLSCYGCCVMVQLLDPHLLCLTCLKATKIRMSIKPLNSKNLDIKNL